MRFPPTPTSLDRYIFRQLLWALIAVTIGLTAAIWRTRSPRSGGLVVNRGLSLLVLVRLTRPRFTGFIAVILPVITYVVIRFIDQRLTGDRKATGPRAAGLLPIALARPAIAAAAGVWLNVIQALAAFLSREDEFTSEAAAA